MIFELNKIFFSKFWSKILKKLTSEREFLPEYRELFLGLRRFIFVDLYRIGNLTQVYPIFPIFFVRVPFPVVFECWSLFFV